MAPPPQGEQNHNQNRSQHVQPRGSLALQPTQARERIARRVHDMQKPAARAIRLGVIVLVGLGHKLSFNLQGAGSDSA